MNMRFTAQARSFLVAALMVPLAACGPTIALNPGLSQRMDAPGAKLDQAAALNILNHYRATQGVGALAIDTDLSTKAQSLAQSYAQTGTSPQKPDEALALLTSAGYVNFADVFSGWRNSPGDAKVLANGAAEKAGIGVVSAPNSAYGVHWVLILH